MLNEYLNAFMNAEKIPKTLSVDMATRIVFQRCLNILQESDPITCKIKEFNTEHLIAMCNNVLSNSYPIDKMNRWLGFVQAGMLFHELIDVTTERDITRPIFHLAYKTESQKIPESVDIVDK